MSYKTFALTFALCLCVAFTLAHAQDGNSQSGLTPADQELLNKQSSSVQTNTPSSKMQNVEKQNSDKTAISAPAQTQSNLTPAEQELANRQLQNQSCQPNTQYYVFGHQTNAVCNTQASKIKNTQKHKSYHKKYRRSDTIHKNTSQAQQD